MSKEIINNFENIDAVNIDLKSFDKLYYKNTLKADLNEILNNIKLLHKKNIWIEITTLIIEDINSSTNELSKIAKFIYSISDSIPWHITAFYPNYKMDNHQYTKENILDKAYNIAKNIGLKYVYKGNIKTDINSYCECGAVLVNRKDHLLNTTCPNCKNEISGVYF
jgi:pyruvate formate lyase activating enzyme